MCRIWARSDARVARNLQINYGTWSSRDSDALCVSASRQVELGDGRVDWLPGSASATGAPACACIEISASMRQRADGSKGLCQTVVCGAGTRPHQRNLSVTNAIATDVVLGGREEYSLRHTVRPCGPARSTVRIAMLAVPVQRHHAKAAVPSRPHRAVGVGRRV
jgi:hypothetical protein